MVAMGIVVDTKDSLGLEASGVVTRTGKEVNNIKVGDRVAMLASGLLSTHKVVCARQVMPIPQHLSFEEAATIPVVYATATYAIMHLGQLTKDQVNSQLNNNRAHSINKRNSLYSYTLVQVVLARLRSASAT